MRFNQGMSRHLTRREFLRMLGAAGLAAGLSACQKAVAFEPTATLQPTVLPTQLPTGSMTPSPAPTATPQPTPSPTWSPAALPQAISPAEANFLAAHEVRTGDTTRPVVLLTYDDNGDSIYINYLLDALAAAHVKATFFFVGTALSVHKDDIRRMVSEGHALGCHGFSHDHTYLELTDAQINAELERYLNEMAAIVPGYRVRWWRAPYGSRSQHVRDLAAAWGLQHVMWTRVSDGWSKTAYKIADAAEPGDIILGHMFRYFDIYQSPQIIARLQERGFSLETLDTGLARESYVNNEI